MAASCGRSLERMWPCGGITNREVPELPLCLRKFAVKGRGKAQGLVDLVVAVRPRLSRNAGEACSPDFGRSDRPDEGSTPAARPRLARVDSVPQSTDKFLAINRGIALHVEIHIAVERDGHESVRGAGHGVHVLLS